MKVGLRERGWEDSIDNACEAGTAQICSRSNFYPQDGGDRFL
jgi:hypothetical protein